MGSHLRPAAALDPGTLSRCYRGGLTRETKAQRLQACTLLLLVGRLGLRPGELQHLHEGWVDWERGRLHVPARDPCACAQCWERARVRQRGGDGRPLADVVAADCWRPPGGEGRTIDFGWSRRLTGVLAAGFDAWSYLDCDVTRAHAVLGTAAEAADLDDPTALTLGALRASAATFMVDAGLSAAQVAAVLGVERAEVAGVYDALRARGESQRGEAQRSGSQRGESDTVAADPGAYALVTETAALDGEPFDPATYDAAWRREREASREPRPSRSPRPAEIPDGVTYEPPTGVTPSYHDLAADGAASDRSTADGGALARWAGTDGDGPAQSGRPASGAGRAVEGVPGDERAEAAGGVGPEAGEDPAVEEGERDGRDTGPTPADPREQVTAPVRLDVSTRFACEAIHGGRPAGGSVLLAQSELVLVTHGDGENVAHEVVPLHAVRDVAVGYCPDVLADVFDETVGLAYERDGRRHVAVVELPEAERHTLASVLFARRLDGCAAVVTHPAREGGHETDATPWRGVLDVDAAWLAGAPVAGADPRFRFRLADVLSVERGRNRFDGTVYHGLAVRSVGADGGPVTTTITPVAEADRTVFVRFLRGVARRRARRAREVDVRASQENVLLALSPGEDSVSISALLDRDPDSLRTVLDALERAGLVRVAADGPRLTGTGTLLVEETVDDRDG